MFMVTGKGCSVCRRLKKVVEEKGLDVTFQDVEVMNEEELETVVRSGIKELPILVTQNGIFGCYHMSDKEFVEIVNANI